MSFDNLFVIAAVAAAIPLLLGSLRITAVPGPVLEIVAGIVLGPAVLGVVQLDDLVRSASVLGLGFLLFLAGVEIDLSRFRGDLGLRALQGVLLTVALGLAVGYGLHLVGLASDPVLVGIALMATSLGLLVPLLRDAGLVDQPVGQLAIAGASTGEVTAVVLLSLLFSQHDGPLLGRLALLALLLVVVLVVAVLARRAERRTAVSELVRMLADTSAQIRVRLSVLLLVGLAAAAVRLGFEAILGAFLAGGLLRALDPDSDERHPQFRVKLDGLGFGFLIPIFFVTSGITFDLDALMSHPATLLRVPLYLVLLLVVRGLPALAYHKALTSRQTVAVGLLQASSLPFIVAATQIGLALGAISAGNAAALVTAGLVSVLAYPALALRLLHVGAPRRPITMDAM